MSEQITAAEFRIPVVADTERLDRQMRDIVQEGKRAGRETGEAFADASERTNTFRERTQAATSALVGLAMIVVSRVSGAFRGFGGLLLRTTTGLIDLGALGALKVASALDRMAESTRDANGELTRIGQATKVAGNALETFAKIALTATGIITGLQLAAAAAAATLIVLSHRAAAQFEPSWNRVLSVLGRSGDGFHSLKGEVSDLAAAMGTDATEGADVLYEIFGAMPQLIDKPSRAMGLLKESLEAGSTGFTTAGEAADAVIGILNAFNMEVERSTEVTNALWAAQDAGKFTLGEVAREIGPVSATISSLGGDYKDLLAILAVTTPLNIAVPEAVTQIESALGNLMKQSGEAQQAARDLGIEFGVQEIRAKGLANVLVEVIEATKGDPEILGRLFGRREGHALMIQLSQRLPELRDRIEEITTSQGRHREIVDQMNDSWEAQKRILGGQFPGMLRKLGFEFEGWGVQALRAINSVLFAMQDLDEQGNRLAKTPTPWSHMDDAVRAEQARLRELDERRRKERDAKNAAPTQPTNLLGSLVTIRPPVAAAVAEPATLTHAQEKIDALERTLRAAAVANLARTNDMKAYTAETRRAQEQVNALVISEMERLRAAGVESAVVEELASKYQALGKERDAEAERARREAEAAAKALTARVREFSLLQQAGVLTAEAPADPTEQVQEIMRLEREIAEIEKERKTAGGEIATQASALVEARRQELTLVKEAFAQGVKNREEIRAQLDAVTASIVQLAPKLADPIADGMGRIQKAVEEAQRAADRLKLANSTGTQAQITAAAKEHAAAQERVRQAVARVQREMQLAGVSGKRMNELTGEMVKLLGMAGVEAKNLETGTLSFVDGLARGVLSAVDAMGMLDDRTRRTFQGVIDLVGALQKAADAKKLVDSAGSLTGAGQLAVFGAGAMALGAVAGIVSAFKASADQQRKAEEERLRVIYRQMEEMRRNTEALQEFRTGALSGMTGAERDRMKGTLTQASDWFGFSPLGGTPNNITMEQLTAWARTNGIDLQELLGYIEKLEKLSGAKFFDAERGITNFKDFNAAVWEFAHKELSNFGEDLTGRLDAMDYAFRVAGDSIGDASQRMRMFLDVLHGIPEATGFAEAFGRILQEQGAEAANAWLQEQAVLFSQSGADALGWARGLTPAEIQRIIDAGLARIEQGGGLLGEGAQTRLSVGITEVQANVLLSYQASQLYHLAGIHALLGGRQMPTITPPSPAALGLAPSSSGGGTTVIQFGDLHVDVALSGVQTSDPAALGRAAGSAFGEAFGDRIGAKFRAAGLQRPRFLTDQDRRRR